MISDEQVLELKVKELDEQIGLYDEAGYPAFDAEKGEDKPKVPKDRDGKVAFLQALRKETGGFPKRVTEEDLTENPALVGEVDVDEVIIVPFPAELSDEEKAKAEAELEEQKKKEEEEAKAKEEEDKKKAKAEKDAKKNPDANATAKPTAPIVYYKGVQVLSSYNEVVNGKLYKKVNCIDASYLLSEEEFTNEVK